MLHRSRASFCFQGQFFSNHIFHSIHFQKSTPFDSLFNTMWTHSGLIAMYFDQTTPCEKNNISVMLYCVT